MDPQGKVSHAKTQQALQNQIVQLERELKQEDDVTKTAILKIERKCLEMEDLIKEIGNEKEEALHEQYLTQLAEKKRQLKQIEVNTALINELRKENKKLRKQQIRLHEKHDSISNKASKIEEMNSSLSSLHESIGSIVDYNETKHETLQSDYDTTRATNKEMKMKLKKQQGAYWEAAQARLEYQKAMAKILTLIQNKLDENKDGKVAADTKFHEGVEEMVALALEVEAEAKIEMASLDVELAGTEVLSDTCYTEVSEVSGHDNSDPYLEINIAPTSSQRLALTDDV